MNNLWNILTSYSSFEFLLFLILSAAKTTFLLAFVALLCLIFRRFSAATRHLLWTSVLCASLLLPFLSFVKIWEVPILPASTSEESAAEPFKIFAQNKTFEMSEFGSLEAQDKLKKASEFQADTEFLKEKPLSTANENEASSQKSATSLLPQFVNWFLIVWGAGVLLLLARLLVGLAATNLLSRRATTFKDQALNELFSSLLVELNLKNTVRLLRSERTLMPVVCGIFRPAVLLPADAGSWCQERQRVVLIHELTHVVRRDCLTQTLGQLACAFYWFNPFIWAAARRLRIEREQACDDFVLSIGTKPSEYAHHLLEIARSMQERSFFEWSQTSSVAMARRSQLEGRLLAILNKENNRIAVSRALTAGLVTLVFVLFVSLAVIRPTTINAQTSQAAETVSDSRGDKPEKSLLDSFLNAGSKTENQPAANDSQFPNAIKETENMATVDKTQNKVLAEVQINSNTGDTTKSEVSTTPPQLSENLLLPNAEPPMEPETLTISPAKYERERKIETQDREQDFIEEMASVGYTNLSVEDLVRLKSVGVTANYVRSLRAAGFNNLTIKELTQLRALSVTPAFIEGISKAGYKDLSVKEITSFKAVGVTPELIGKYRAAGYDNLSAKDLSQFTVHGITGDYISSMNSLGFGKLSPKDLVSLRVFSITPAFVRNARARLGNDLTIRQIIDLKNMGILKDNE
jgi:beta-lactamase regulating signal transducer with metallopeptidase domain